MREFKTDIIIFIVLLVLALIILLLTIGQSTIDIQLHDTYFILDKISVIVLVIGPLTFLIFLTRALIKKFKTQGANIGLITGLILIALITYQVVGVQQSYVSEMMRIDDEGLSDRGQFIVDVKKRINLTWGLLCLWTMGIFLLTLRTIKIWRKGYSS